MSDLAAITEQLERWFDEGERAALDEAGRLAAAQPVDIDALLHWVDTVRGPGPEARDLARRALRFALGLRVVPGAVCRPTQP